jgi:hypothetical protein
MAFWRSRLCSRASSHPESLQGSDALTAFVSIIRGCPFLVMYSYYEGSEDHYKGLYWCQMAVPLHSWSY